MYRITIGIGVQNTHGREVEIPSISALISALHAHTAHEAWWAPHRWEGAARTAGDVWRSSGLIILDVDMMSEAGLRAIAEGRKPAAEDHITLPAETLAAVELLAAQGGLRASAWHPTPRGLRLIRWMASETTDAATYRATAAVACEEAQVALADIRGLVVDRGTSCDLKRLMWGPRALVGGVQRGASVAVLRAEPWEWVTPPAGEAKPKRSPKPTPPPVRPNEPPDTDFAPAAARWNRDHDREWPKRKERCPMCGTDDASPSWSVGDEPDRWACFSSRHTSGGQRGPQAWHGDELDLAAALAGLRPYDVLVRDGYLRAPRAATVSTPRGRTSTAEAPEREPGSDDDAPALAPTAAPVARWEPKVIRGGPGSSPADAEPIPFDSPAVTVGDVGGDDFEPRAHGLRWPGSAWRVQDGGRVERKSAGMDAPATVSTAPIYVAGRSRDILTGEVVLVVRWRGAGGWQELAIPRGEALDGRGIVKYAGQDLPVSSVSAKELVRYLAEFEAANLGALPTGRVSSALGWVGRGTDGGYLWGSELLCAPTGADPVSFNGAGPGEAQLAKGMERGGTLAGWQAAIAPMLAHGAACMALWAVFAAPLLAILRRPGFTVDLSGGGSTTGKSTACRAAMSAVGDPQRISRSWEARQVGVERLLALHGGGVPLYLDDTRRAIHEEDVGRVLMAVHNSDGRSRGAVRGMATTASWRTVLLSTGEDPAVSLGQRAGEQARCVSVTALPFGVQSEAMGRLAKRIEAGTNLNYGHALPLFVQYVAGLSPDRLRERWAQLEEEQSGQLVSQGAIALRLAGHRAVLALARELAYASGVLNGAPAGALWGDSGEAAALAVSAPEEVRARARIASWAVSEAASFVGSESEPREGPKVVLGRWCRDENWLAILPNVLTDRLKKWGFSPEAVVRGCVERGWIVKGEGKNNARTVRITPSIRTRAYVFKLDSLLDEE